MSDKEFYVYMHTNKVNGKKYIGQTCQKPEQRWEGGEGYKRCILFYRAIQKYGWESFEHEILYDGLTLEEANSLEEELISSYDTTNPQKGYNIRFGGNNRKLSPEIRQKIREARIGTHHKEESKKKISEASKGSNNGFYGKRHSKENLEKMRESKSGVNNPMYGVESPMKGKHHTEGTKRKISKPVRCVETGVVYFGQHEAMTQTNICQSSIGKCCRGKQKTAGGFHWEFVA